MLACAAACDFTATYLNRYGTDQDKHEIATRIISPDYYTTFSELLHNRRCGEGLGELSIANKFLPRELVG